MMSTFIDKKLCNSLHTQILLPLYSQNLSNTPAFQIWLVVALISYFTIGHLLFLHTSFSTSAVCSALVLTYASHCHCTLWSFHIRAKCGQSIQLLTYCCRPGAGQNAVGAILQRYGQPSLTNEQVMSAFNQIQWTQQQVNNLENDLLNGNAFTYCISRDGVCIHHSDV